MRRFLESLADGCRKDIEVYIQSYTRNSETTVHGKEARRSRSH